MSQGQCELSYETLSGVVRVGGGKRFMILFGSYLFLNLSKSRTFIVTYLALTNQQRSQVNFSTQGE
jgi:hypothetical protein